MNELPLYFIVYSFGGSGHLSLFVFAGNNLYSLGFGYLGDSEAISNKIARISASVPADAWKTLQSSIHQAALYNYDSLITDNLNEITSSGDPYRFPIVSIGFFNRNHANKILEIANKNNKLYDIEINNKGIRTFGAITLNMAYSTASHPLMYTISGGGFNCTSFLEYVFNEKINCRGGPQGKYIVSHPHECTSLAPYLGDASTSREKAIDMNARFKQIMKEYVVNKYSPETIAYLNYGNGAASTGRKLLTWALGLGVAALGGAGAYYATRSHANQHTRRLRKRKSN